MNKEEAASLVFAHWEYLSRLCKRQFQGDTNLEEEASQYVLDKLEANDWNRVQEWEGKGNFKVFLAVLVNRLLIDFYRNRFGYQRPPKWLRAEIEKEEKVVEQQKMANNGSEGRTSFWHMAYMLLYRENYTRQETIERLVTLRPRASREAVEHIVSTVLGRCPPRIVSPDALKKPLDELGEMESEYPDPLDECLQEEERMWEKLAGSLLLSENGISSQFSNKRIERFQLRVQLTEEDRMILRLRFAEGLSVRTIAKMLDLKGDPYNRLRRIIRNLESAFRQVDLYAAHELTP